MTMFWKRVCGCAAAVVWIWASLSALPAAPRASAAGMTYSDVTQEAPWALEHVAEQAQRGVFTGYEDGTFRPRASVTRIEAIVAAVRSLGLRDQAEAENAKTPKLRAKDAKLIEQDYAWAVGYLAVAEKRGLLADRTAAVEPAKAADRLWATKLLVRTAALEKGVKGAEAPDFRDIDGLAAEDAGYVAVAVENGLVTGYEDGTFRPEQTVSRAELAALLNRAGPLLPVKDSKFAELEGTVGGVSGNTVTVTVGRASQPFPMALNATIVRNQALVGVGELRSGDRIKGVVQDYKFVHITVTQANNAAPAPTPAPSQTPGGANGTDGGTGSGAAGGGGPNGNGTGGGASSDLIQNGPLSGTVSAVEEGLLTITAISAGTPLFGSGAYPVTDDVAIVVNGLKGSWSDIRWGDTVTVMIRDGRIYHVSLTTIAPVVRDIEGYVSEAHRNQVSIASGGVVTMLPVDKNAIIQRLGEAVTVDDLKPGDQVTGFTENGVVKMLYVFQEYEEWTKANYVIEGIYQGHRMNRDGKITEFIVSTQLEGNPIRLVFAADSHNLIDRQNPPAFLHDQTRLKLIVINQTVVYWEIIT